MSFSKDCCQFVTAEGSRKVDRALWLGSDRGQRLVLEQFILAYLALLGTVGWGHFGDGLSQGDSSLFDIEFIETLGLTVSLGADSAADDLGHPLFQRGPLVKDLQVSLLDRPQGPDFHLLGCQMREEEGMILADLVGAWFGQAGGKLDRS